MKIMEENFEKQRRKVVESLERMGHIKSKAVKKAMLKVKREQFVLPEYKNQAYVDTPLPIPGNQTISAPHKN